MYRKHVTAPGEHQRNEHLPPVPANSDGIITTPRVAPSYVSGAEVTANSIPIPPPPPPSAPLEQAVTIPKPPPVPPRTPVPPPKKQKRPPPPPPNGDATNIAPVKVSEKADRTMIDGYFNEKYVDEWELRDDSVEQCCSDVKFTLSRLEEVEPLNMLVIMAPTYQREFR